MYCVSFRPRVASSQSFRHDDIVFGVLRILVFMSC